MGHLDGERSFPGRKSSTAPGPPPRSEGSGPSASRRRRGPIAACRRPPNVSPRRRSKSANGSFLTPSESSIGGPRFPYRGRQPEQRRRFCRFFSYLGGFVNFCCENIRKLERIPTCGATPRRRRSNMVHRALGYRSASSPKHPRKFHNC